MATAIGSTGDLFGLAIGFLIPPFIVKTPTGADKNIHMLDLEICKWYRPRIRVFQTGYVT